MYHRNLSSLKLCIFTCLSISMLVINVVLNNSLTGFLLFIAGYL